MKIKPHQVTIKCKTNDSHIIKLRPLTERDWNLLYKWHSDPKIIYFASSSDVKRYTKQEVRDMFRIGSQIAFSFIIKYNNKPIGVCWLRQVDDEYIHKRFPRLDCHRIYPVIGEKKYWGKGIGTKVIYLLTEFGFKKEKCDMIFGIKIADYNKRSMHAFKKLGYAVKTKKKQRAGFKAKYFYDLAITKDKFLENAKSLMPAGIIEVKITGFRKNT